MLFYLPLEHVPACTAFIFAAFYNTFTNSSTAFLLELQSVKRGNGPLGLRSNARAVATLGAGPVVHNRTVGCASVSIELPQEEWRRTSDAIIPESNGPRPPLQTGLVISALVDMVVQESQDVFWASVRHGGEIEQA
jgi:hypothetical protein